jgi:integrase
LIGGHAPDFATAKDEAHRAITAKLNGRDPKRLQPSDDPTVDQLLKEYDAEKPRKDRWQIGRIVATPLPSPTGLLCFGDWRLSAVTPDLLRQYRNLRPLVAGNRDLTRDLTLLRAAFNWGVLNGLLPHSPFRIGDVPAVKVRREEPRTRRLHPGEAERLELHGQSMRDLIIAALETGMRKGELLTLQWAQVRFSPRA